MYICASCSHVNVIISFQIIDAYMYSLLRDTRSEYQYIPCCVMSLMLSSKHQCKVADVEVTAESIIGLFNMGRRHWILVIISASVRRMTVLNPLGEVDELLTSLLSTWKSFLANSPTNFSLTLGPNWEVVTIPHSKQLDSTSCGIFCLKFAEKLLKQEELLLPSKPNNIFQYRLDILESIAKNQDSTIKELCRCCGCKMLLGKEKRVQWIGCDQCGDFWIHYQCMKTNDSYKTVSEIRYVCVFCQI
ncbi:hypothetical protein CHS0354_014579 [Potamilus streckersoni]|uniref:Ubiquitin-like protease family profile domain-containing protein n=1 Tax=Potamilus streckersoni TaxID=2493646 RepID=A0AAE0VG34_9BIVA|nr:hypothetical protein CHS0354_014579 [Potamilus streckersoni]